MAHFLTLICHAGGNQDLFHDEMFSENEAESRSVNELPEIIPNKQCSECKFEGKSGLKINMKTDHKIKCDT